MTSPYQFTTFDTVVINKKMWNNHDMARYIDFYLSIVTLDEVTFITMVEV